MKKKLETRQTLPYLFPMMKNNAMQNTLESYRHALSQESKAALALAREVGAYKGIVEAISKGWVPGVTVTDTKALEALLSNVPNLVNR